MSAAHWDAGQWRRTVHPVPGSIPMSLDGNGHALGMCSEGYGVQFLRSLGACAERSATAMIVVELLGRVACPV